MLRVLSSVVAAFVALGALGGTASAQRLGHADMVERINHNTVTVMSGNPNGTYLYLAYDMSAVLDDGNDLRVLPIIGKGGYQNVLDVLYLKDVDLCITQSNIMSYLKKNNEFGPNIDRRVVYITKLYNEEFHVLAGPGIKTLKDLEGKTVNLSDAGSGTQFSTRQVLELLGIKVKEINVGQADGYQMLKSGEIAATVLVAGKPAGSFAKFKLEPGMTLLPIPFAPALEDAGYLPATLTSADYPTLIPQGQQIETLAVGAVLASYNWAPGTERYQRVAKFVTAFFTKIGEFQKPSRHPKWKDVNLAATLKGWTRFPVAQDWIEHAKLAASVGTGPVVVDPALARRQAQEAAPGNAAQQRELFKQFLEWTKRQQQQQ